MSLTTNHFRGPFFQLQYPVLWVHEIIEEIPAFYDPEGSGAVQLAAVKNQPGNTFDLESEMTRYLHRHSIEFDAERMAHYQMEDLDCMACEFVQEERFWMVTLMVKENKLLMVIYNADETPDVELAQSISGIIRSVVFF